MSLLMADTVEKVIGAVELEIETNESKRMIF
jgi:hypothetical protein